ncbi:MAG: NACHT domain-containing protein [Planctomycetes bacterium]|nr:NACHT domain-containing protein [Planctomycetota bacterium]
MVELAAMMPEWERVNWEQTFARLERIEKDQQTGIGLLEELRRAPERQAETFEERYRLFAADEHGSIQMHGIRGPAEVLSLPLDVSFVQLSLAPLPGPKAEDTDNVFDLEAARKRFEAHSGTSAGIDGRSIGHVLAAGSRTVIVGEPGSGKSTLLQYVAFRAARGELSRLCDELGDDADKLVPFLFRVRSLDFDRLPTPAQFMAHCASPLQLEGAGAFVESVLRDGRALLLVDGLDECEVPPAGDMDKARSPADETEWDKVLKWLADLLRAHKGTRVLVTSRPAGYSAGLLEKNEFAEAAIQPLDKAQREAFVRNWCSAAERSDPIADQATADAKGEEQAADLLGRIERTPSIQFLAATPLMLAVICIIHRYKGKALPERRVELLRECVDVLLYEWRRAHGLSETVIGDLDATKQRALLEPLAWEMMVAGKAEYSRDAVETVFRKHLPDINQSPERAEEVLATIRDRTGVLIERRTGAFAFAHLILQEYLAAEEAQRHGLDPLLERANDKDWQELIPLAVGVAKTNQETFIRSLLHKDHLLLAGRCTAAADRLDVALRGVLIKTLVKHLGGTSVNPFFPLLEIGGPPVAAECVAVIKDAPFREYQGMLGDATANRAAYRPAYLVAAQTADQAAYVAAILTARVAPQINAYFAALVATELDANLDIYEPANLAANRAANLSGDSTAILAADILGRLGSDGLGPLQALLADEATPAACRLFALLRLVELIGASHAGELLVQLDRVPRTDYPLLQLALGARFRHRVGNALGPDDQGRLDDFLRDAYGELGLHYVRFAKAIDTECSKRGEPGITDDWPAYEAEFMAKYTAQLDEHNPPGWAKG